MANSVPANPAVGHSRDGRTAERMAQVHPAGSLKTRKNAAVGGPGVVNQVARPMMCGERVKALWLGIMR